MNHKIKNKFDLREFFTIDYLRTPLLVLGGMFIVVFVFMLGMFVGTQKAKFSYRWAENYHRNFAGPRGGFVGELRKFPAGGYINAHGSFGEIIEMKDNGFVIKGPENAEKVVITNQSTTIAQGREREREKFLKLGDHVVVIGSPNDQGQIEAKLIRVFQKR